MIVTATQLKITSVIGFLRFIPFARKTRNQLGQADGLVFTRLEGLYTLTGWESREAMRAYRNNGSHLEAMKNLKRIGQAKSITWEAQMEPGWEEAKEKLRGAAFNASRKGK